MYRVVRVFFDSTDKNRLYKVGDVYPADGVKASKKRVDELVSGTNRNGKRYIEEVNEGDDTQTPPGGGVNEGDDEDNVEDENTSQNSEE